MNRITFPLLSALGAAACVAGLAFALYLEHYRGLEPCPLCVFQRVAMIGALVVFLAGAVHGPKARGQWVYAGLADLAAVTGALVAARHVWLQGLPPDQVPACGPTLDYLMEVLPFTEVVRLVLEGDGNCARIDAAWLGLSLPAWTLVGFVLLSAWATLMPVLPRLLARIAPGARP